MTLLMKTKTPSKQTTKLDRPTSKTGVKIMIGDINVKAVRNNNGYDQMMGKHGQ